MNRSEQLHHITQEKVWDILVVGGGSTGLGVALDAVSRGLSVCLLERDDFGQGTSSKSTKLVHGGVRYLEQGNIDLVKEALQERKYILERAPHLSRVVHFTVPVYSWWKKYYYGIGLKFYQFLSGSKSLSKTKLLSKKEVIEALPNIRQKGLVGGIRYADGQFDDARLCIDLVRTIAKHNGTCLNYCEVTDFLREGNTVKGVTAYDKVDNKAYSIYADTVVNCTGIFSDELSQKADPDSPSRMITSRGSHIVLDRSFLGGEEALMIPKTSDGRVLFAIPWKNRVVVGTTDVKTDITRDSFVSKEEVSFILDNCSRYLDRDPTTADIRSTFAGLRPLVKTGKGKSTKKLSRSHKIMTAPSGLVNVLGGKWTTFRRMGQDTLDHIGKYSAKAISPSTSESITISTPEKPKDDEKLHSDLPYSWSEMRRVIDHELVQNIEDILVRRTRCLLLDIKATEAIVEPVGRLMMTKMGRDEKWLQDQLNSMTKLIENHKL